MKRARIIAVLLVLYSIAIIVGIGQAFSQSSNQTQQAARRLALWLRAT